MMEIRLKKLRERMNKESLDAVLISSVPTITYLTGYSGFSKEERDGYLLVTQTNSYIITSSLHITGVSEQIKNYEPIEITRQKSLKQILSELLKDINHVGFEQHNITVAEFKNISELPLLYKPFSLANFRLIKDKHEIEYISKACKIGDEVFAAVQKYILSDVTETKLSHLLEILVKEHDAGSAFQPVIAFGSNAAVPHHFPGKDTLKMNSFVLIDFGVKYENYCSDMTRTLFFGHANAKQKHMYDTVRTAQELAIAYITDTLKKGDEPIATLVDQTARTYVTDNGYPPFNHSSHGIGLETHEDPHMTRSHEPLQNGMVFSIEPGVYLPSIGGVRIEDLFVIQDNTLIQLTHSSKDLLEI